MNQYPLIIIAISVLCFAGCQDNSVFTGSTNGDGQLYPLKVGNYWNYTYQRYDSSGVAIDTTKWAEVVDGDTSIGGQKYYSIADAFTRFIGFKMYYTNKVDGVYLFLFDTNSFSMVYKYPAKVNDLVIRYSDTLQVVSMRQTVKTPAGEFDCVVYQKVTRINAIWSYERTYISPGIGKIEVEAGYSRDKISMSRISLLQLESYKIL